MAGLAGERNPEVTERKERCVNGHAVLLIGRDSSGRCLACKRQAMAAARQALRDEEEAIRHAEWERWRAERERERKLEYERAIAAGGDEAAEARWQELWTKSLRRGGRGLCQWALENGHPGACTRKAENAWDVYCREHNREVFVDY